MQGDHDAIPNDGEGRDTMMTEGVPAARKRLATDSSSREKEDNETGNSLMVIEKQPHET